MKYVKMLSLAALAATALMALVGVGTASATKGVACSVNVGGGACTSKWAVPTTLDFSLTPGTSAILETTGGSELVTCSTATVKGNLTDAGSSTTTATGSNTEITWGTVATPCTFASTTVKLGKLKIEAEDNSGNGILYADEDIEVTVHVPGFLGGPCLYRVPNGRRIGTWDESLQEFTANAVADRITTNHPCVFGGATNLWTATYIKTTPSNTTLYIATS